MNTIKEFIKNFLKLLGIYLFVAFLYILALLTFEEEGGVVEHSPDTLEEPKEAVSTANSLDKVEVIGKVDEGGKVIDVNTPYTETWTFSRFDLFKGKGTFDLLFKIFKRGSVEQNTSYQGVTEIVNNPVVEEEVLPTLTDDERAKIMEINQINTIRNSLINLNPNATVITTTEETIDKIVEAIKSKNVLGSGISPVSPSTDTDSDFELIVNQIRTGESNTLTIISPKSDASFTQSIDSGSPAESPSTIQRSLSDTNLINTLSQFRNKRCVIMVTNDVEEGEPVPALPSWTSAGFDHKDYFIKRRRLDNLMKSDYVSNHTDNTIPSNRNQEWMDQDDSFNLDSLYESNRKNK